NDISRCVVNRRNSQRYIQHAPILRHPSGFIMHDSRAASNAVKDQWNIVGPVGWDDDCNRLTDHLFGSIAIYPLSALVPSGDDAIQIFTDNRVVGTVHNRGKL